MKTRFLLNSGLLVSRLSFGAQLEVQDGLHHHGARRFGVPPLVISHVNNNTRPTWIYLVHAELVVRSWRLRSIRERFC
jgi:hypothetical protein